MKTAEFQAIVRKYYNENGRTLPWRSDPSPYNVLVSELMLQQTQVERVIPKFQEFVEAFPSIERLAGASLVEVLRLWQGLGYNRRAKYLHEAAKAIVSKGYFPTTVEELTTFPGVGKNTAGAIVAYAYNQPVAYVETNIRTVYFHHFFHGQADVNDKDLLALVERTLPDTDIRGWYSALMDYGVHLKTQGLGKISNSKHYKKQSAFTGSNRQVRGHVIRELSQASQTKTTLRQRIDDERLGDVLEQLCREGLVALDDDGYYRIADTK